MLTSKTYEISKIPFFVKSGMNLSKYFKSSSDLNIIVIDCLSLTENPVSLEISNMQGVSRLMCKDGLHKYFNTLKKVKCHILFQCIIWFSIFAILNYCHCMCHSHPLSFIYRRCLCLSPFFQLFLIFKQS